MTSTNKFLYFLFILSLLTGCNQTNSNHYSQSSSESSGMSYADNSEERELPDGSYSCEATNTTNGYGPYTIDCEKNGDEITVNFPNGGYIVTDIDSIESDGSGNWAADTTHTPEGESWEVEITE